jgi:predicted Rossmann-fold nucleotide-binding protein/SAM-dependent methyltransferase
MPTVTNLPLKEDLPQEKLTPPAREGKIIRSVTFFGDSAIGESDNIYKSVWEAARFLAEKGYAIVDGGGPGLMKAATDGAESVNGYTKAVYWQPKLASYFEGKNLANITDESESISNYMMRTLGLIEKADAFVVCKGGTGTISEFGMVWAIAKLYYGAHKPVILFGEFWDKLVKAIQEAMIIDEVELSVLQKANTAEEILEILEKHEEMMRSSQLQKPSGDEVAFVLSPEPDVTTNTYNRVASEYHSFNVGNLASKEQIDDFMSLVNPPAKVLDVGTGTGADAKALSDKYTVIGIEKSEKMADIARFENPGMKVIQGDLLDVQLNNNEYKGIWARDSLHHIPAESLDLAFAKLNNALVPGGILYVIVREGVGEIMENENKGYGSMERFYHLFSVSDLIERCGKAGLDLVKIDRNKRSHDWLIGVFRKRDTSSESEPNTVGINQTAVE